MKHRNLIVRAITSILTVVLISALFVGCAGKSKVSEEVYEGTQKYIGIFEAHKNDNYSKPTKEEMDQYIEFVNTSKKDATPEEKEILDMLGDVMIAYSTDASEVSKGGEPILFDEKLQELKTLLEQYK